jgi:hypothetical protein
LASDPFVRFGDVRYRYRVVTVHGLNPSPPHDLVHVELQVPGYSADNQALKEELWAALRELLGPNKYDRIWTVSFLGEQTEDKKGLVLSELVALLDQDYF